MKFFRVLRSVLIIAILPLILSGCLSKSMVKLMTTAGAKSYVRQYGAAKLVSSDRAEDKVTYTFKDGQYGFTYQVISSKSAVNIDGAVFGYTRSDFSDFPEVYYGFIKDKGKAEFNAWAEKYDAVIEWNKYPRNIETAGTVALKDVSEEYINAALSEFSRIFKGIDTREYYWRQVEVYKDNFDLENAYGAYDMREGKYLTEQELDVEFYMQRAAEKLRVNRKNLTYKRMFTVKISEVPGLDVQEIVHILGSPDRTGDDNCNVYVFEYENTTYCVTDVYIRDELGYMFYYMYKE